MTPTAPLLTARRALLVAAVFVVPYLLLATAWVFANPGGAAPDEDAHLVKALGVARLDIGTPGPLAPPTASLGAQRNASISRLVTIPGPVSPAGYICFAFKPAVTAACQDAAGPRATGDVKAYTTLGAYPPYVYPPIGLAAQLGHTPSEAFRLGRLVVLVESTLLLLLASWHLVRWLGRRALLGVMVIATPGAVFCMAIVNTSGLEIFGALCVASVVTVYARRPESLHDTGTQVVMLVGGGLLVLSRQLGLVTMGALLLALLALGGWREVLAEVKRRRPWMVAAIAVIGLCTLASIVWELRYDHPVLVGPYTGRLSWEAWWRTMWIQVVQSSIGWFGWLEVRMPPWMNNIWAYTIASLTVLGVLLGRWRDRALIIVLSLALVAVGYVVYSSVFFPIRAGIQGRHLIPFAAVIPVYAGVVLAEKLPRVVYALLVGLLAVPLPALQLYGFVLSSQRYAVGMPRRSVDFVSQAAWTPPLGWYTWLVLAAVAVVLMAASWVWIGVTARRDTVPPVTPAAPSAPALTA